MTPQVQDGPKPCMLNPRYPAVDNKLPVSASEIALSTLGPLALSFFVADRARGLKHAWTHVILRTVTSLVSITAGIVGYSLKNTMLKVAAYLLPRIFESKLPLARIVLNTVTSIEVSESVASALPSIVHDLLLRIPVLNDDEISSSLSSYFFSDWGSFKGPVVYLAAQFFQSTLIDFATSNVHQQRIDVAYKEKHLAAVASCPRKRQESFIHDILERRSGRFLRIFPSAPCLIGLNDTILSLNGDANDWTHAVIKRSNGRCELLIKSPYQRTTFNECRTPNPKLIPQPFFLDFERKNAFITIEVEESELSSISLKQNASASGCQYVSELQDPEKLFVLSGTLPQNQMNILQVNGKNYLINYDFAPTHSQSAS